MNANNVIFIFIFYFFCSCTTGKTTSVYNKTSENYKQTTVSWYNDKFHGRKTASGELYDKRKLTAAHRTLPFGTKVEIVNPDNGRKVVVKITDRGPFKTGREFDLSKEAFKTIASLDKGIVKIKYRILK